MRSLPHGGTRLAIGDLNGDGAPDLAFTSIDEPANADVTILLNHGDGTFPVIATVPVGQSNYGCNLALTSEDSPPKGHPARSGEVAGAGVCRSARTGPRVVVHRGAPGRTSDPRMPSAVSESTAG